MNEDGSLLPVLYEPVHRPNVDRAGREDVVLALRLLAMNSEQQLALSAGGQPGQKTPEFTLHAQLDLCAWR
jgi:hypothetical protein